MDDPNQTTPSPDVVALQQQLTNLQTKLGEQGTELGSLRQQNQELTTKMNSTQTPPASTEGNGGSLFDWSGGQMRTDQGQVNPSLYESMKKAGAAPEHVDALVSTVETAQRIVENQKTQAITSTVGSQENFNSLLEWAGKNSSSAKVRSANTLIQNIDTLPVGLEMLKTEAEANGFTVGVENPPTSQGNEPSPLPTTTGAINPTITPLVPGSSEALKTVSDPRMTTDPAFRAEVTKRLELGMKQ